MKHGAFTMIPKTDDKVCYGNNRHPQRSKRALMSKSHMKTMLIPFFDIKGIVHIEFVPQGQTVNRGYNVAILKRWLEAVHRKRRVL
jgi:hypothetical protein